MRIITIGNYNFNLDNIASIEFKDDTKPSPETKIYIRIADKLFTEYISPEDFPGKDISARACQMAFNCALNHMIAANTNYAILDMFLPISLPTVKE